MKNMLATPLFALTAFLLINSAGELASAAFSEAIPGAGVRNSVVSRSSGSSGSNTNELHWAKSQDGDYCAAGDGSHVPLDLAKELCPRLVHYTETVEQASAQGLKARSSNSEPYGHIQKAGWLFGFSCSDKKTWRTRELKMDYLGDTDTKEECHQRAVEQCHYADSRPIAFYDVHRTRFHCIGNIED